MDVSAGPRVSKGTRVRWAARVIMILWALFWLWFVLAGGIGDLARLGPMGVIPELGVVAIMFVCLLIAWFAEVVGGLLLIAAGLVAYFFYNVAAEYSTPGGIFRLVVMVLPPVIAGVLLAVNRWNEFKRRAATPTPAALT